MSEYPIFIKFETTTFLIYVDNYTTVDQLIDLIKIKVFEKLKLDIFKFENQRFNFRNNKIRKFDSDQLKLSIFDSSFENFFIVNQTYIVNLLSFELPDDPYCFDSLKKIVKFLEIMKKSGNQVIISPYSANVTEDYTKNILQQFHYNVIERETTKIIYLLIDGSFFNDRNEEVYYLLNCKEMKLPNMINVKNLKLFQLEKPYIHYKTPPEYEELFNELVLEKIENKKVLFLILKCKIDNEILNFLKNYRYEFQFRSFGGGEYDFWFNK